MKEKLTKDKKRVNSLGEVYTPEWLIEKMLSPLDESKFENSQTTFLDPSCGNGNILVKIFLKKKEAGLSNWEALSTIFGVDIMQDNVEECRERLLNLAGVKQKKYKKLLETTIVRGNLLEQPANILFAEYKKKYMKDKSSLTAK